MDTETLSPKELLVRALRDEYERLEGVEAGTEERKAIVDEIVKLQDRLNDLEKNEAERVEKEASRQSDLDLKNRQLEEQITARENDIAIREAQRKDEMKYRIIGYGITIAFGLLELASFRKARHETFQFEKEGTVTTGMGRGILSACIPKRRKP